MTKAAIWAILILATGAVIAGLYFFRELLTQVALALVLWLAIEAMAVHVRRFAPPKFPDWAATTIAVVGILGLTGFVGYQVVRNVGAMAARAADYEERIDKIIADIYGAMHLGAAPTTDTMLSRVDITAVLTWIANGAQSVAGNTVFILIYLGFMFPAAARIHKKLDRIFPDDGDRSHARDVLTAIRRSMAQYLWVQTVLSAITTVLTYFTLLALGLDNAIFWSFLIFFLNYIPTIGSIAAVILPTAFALVQYDTDTLLWVSLVAFGIGFWQFVIGNLIAPRMMGESLNLSALVVLISLTFWSQLWGIVGAFLAAPLMVMIMLTLAQFPNTRWVAILLSEDGEPGVPRRPPEKIGAGLI